MVAGPAVEGFAAEELAAEGLAIAATGNIRTFSIDAISSTVSNPGLNRFCFIVGLPTYSLIGNMDGPLFINGVFLLY